MSRSTISTENPDPNTGGHIFVEGSLVVRGNATLQSTNIDVAILDLDDPNAIQYNNIILRQAGAGFGGEFFVSGNTQIICNNIVSEGDRYLDLDPDPADEQPPPPYPPDKIGSIERIDNDPDIPPGAGGVMEMRTRATGMYSATSIAAKGAFARAGDEIITVEFEYMFIEDPYDEAEIIVYLSDQPDVGDNLVEIARIKPPEPGRPGSLSSGQFGLFSGAFARGTLNFVRGTYVELELRGQDAKCWIDDWNPTVHCSGAVCGEYDNSIVHYGVNIYDFLILLAEIGLVDPGDIGKGCLNLVTDGCINTDDLDLDATAQAQTGNVPEGRLITDSHGNIYQIDSFSRLIRLDTADELIEPNPNISYQGSRVSVGGDLKTQVYRYSIDTTNPAQPDLLFDDTIDINSPAPEIHSQAVGYIAIITSMTVNHRDGTLYATGFTAPKFPATGALPNGVDSILS